MPPENTGSQDHVDKLDRAPTIVQVIRSNWHVTIAIFVIFSFLMYMDGRDGQIRSHGSDIPLDEFFWYVVPLLIIIQIPYIALVYFYPRYIEKLKNELREIPEMDRDENGDNNKREPS